MRGLPLYIALLEVCFCCGISAQQKARILKGVVRDLRGEVVVGAVVRFEGSSHATLTDEEGRYTLSGSWEEGGVVSFSFVGMKKVRIPYRGQGEIDVFMEEKAEILEEAVIVARPNINELDIRERSGIVQRVDMRRLNSKPMFNMPLALQGAVPGLVVINTGDLGRKPKIRIRGNSSFRKGDMANEPLYVKDGLVISAEAFMMMNPADIKEIKVLKDAVACALYGVKAANGVIEITSVRGNPDGRITTVYAVHMGITARGRRGIEMMDTEEKLELERRLRNPAAPGYGYSEEYYRKYHAASPDLERLIASGKSVLDSLKGIHTDWFKELIHANIYRQHNLSLRGGTKQTSYSVSLNYSCQGGRIEGNDAKRFAAGFKLDQQIGKWGYLSLSADAAYGRTDTPNGSDESPADLVYKLNPYETKRGKLYSFPRGDCSYDDIMRQYVREATDKKGGIGGSVNLRFFDALSVDAVTGVDLLLNEDMSLVPSTSSSERNSFEKEEARGKLTKDKSVTTNITSNIRVTYEKMIAGVHHLLVGANTDYYMTNVDRVGITGYGVGDRMSPPAINHALTGYRRPKIASFKEKTAQMGWGMVFGYTYDAVYDLFATYKVDASSVLPAGKRWNAAWAVGAGWILSEYPLFKEKGYISRLNLRASYGRIANLAGVSAEATIGTFSYTADYYAGVRRLHFRALPNLHLRAEQTETFDLALSAEIMKRFSIEINFYRRETKDALLDVPIALSNGFPTMKSNIGILRNEGYELGSRLNILERGDYRLNLRGTLAYNRNKVVDLYYTDRLYTSETALVPDYETGKPYDLIFGLKSLGVNPITGLPVFQGAGGEEISAIRNVSKENIFSLGHGTPPFSGSVNFGFSCRNIDFDMDFYYVFGGMRAYGFAYVRSMSDSYKNAVKGQLQNMWFKKGDRDKYYHSPFYSSSAIASLTYPNTRTVGKSDFLRLSMLSLRYRVPGTFLRKYCPVIRYANAAFQASNLFTLTPYGESDPETGSLAGTLQPVLTLNLNLTF